MAKTRKSKPTSNVGFEETLWAAADKMRNNMDPAEYKHVVLGLIFLKYISDSFEEVYKQIKADPDYYEGQEEDKDVYVGENVFWVPKEARWEYLKSNAKKPEIGKMIDDAMVAIEKDNATLKGVLSKNYARPDLDKVRLGELIDLISTIGLGDKESRSKDVLGRVYEYFLGRFASAEGKGGGEFFTPQCVVKLLVEMLEPFKGRVYDPCCGSGGMFVQSERFAEAHGGNKHDISVYGQESNPTTWRLCKMNLAIRGIEGNLGPHNADTFHNDLHKDLKADYILANPPFNISDWGGERLKDDVRWKYGVPPAGNANYGWIQHMIHHLSPTGIAGFVLANASLSTGASGEDEIRKNLIKDGLVDCIVALPTQLFYTTQIHACLWFVSRDRHDHKFRDRRDEILFIDARKMGTMVTRKNRELTNEDVAKISNTYHCWRTKDCEYADVKGFCRAAKITEVEKNKYILAPGQYIESGYVGEEDLSFEENTQKISSLINAHYDQLLKFEKDIQSKFAALGYDALSKIHFSAAKTSILEALIQQLFRSWFINFDFPDQKGSPYKTAGGTMIDSDLGQIPKGWRLGNLSELVNNVSERFAGNNAQERRPYVPIDKIRSKELSLSSVASPEDAKSSLIAFRKDDILFGAMRPYFHKVAISPFNGVTRTTCLVLRPINKDAFPYCALLIFQNETIDYANMHSEGSTIPYVKWNGSMENMTVIIPPDEVLKRFNDVAYPLLEKIRDSYFEI